MTAHSTTPTLLRRPSGFIPLVMSLVAAALPIVHAVVYGIVHQADEGTPAHLFWLLMAVQLPIALYFAFKWVPQRPRAALFVVALQAVAWIGAWVPVYFLT